MEFAETFFRLKVAYDGLRELEGEQPASEREPQQESELQQATSQITGVSLIQRVSDALQGILRSTQREDKRDFGSDLR